MIGFLTRRRGKMTKFEELSMREKVALGELQIKEILALVENHVNDNKIDVNVVISAAIAIVAGNAMGAPTFFTNRSAFNAAAGGGLNADHSCLAD